MNNTLKQLWSVIGLWLLALNANQAWAAITYVHTDHLGSVIAESNSAGQITKRFHYKPFGESIESQQDDIGYSAHKFDTDLGLSYMQARYYDPVLGRFYSNDSVGYVAKNPVMSFNRYLYVNNNPYRYTDPDGRFGVEFNSAIRGDLTTARNVATLQSNVEKVGNGELKSQAPIILKSAKGLKFACDVTAVVAVAAGQVEVAGPAKFAGAALGVEIVGFEAALKGESVVTATAIELTSNVIAKNITKIPGTVAENIVNPESVNFTKGITEQATQNIGQAISTEMQKQEANRLIEDANR